MALPGEATPGNVDEVTATAKAEAEWQDWLADYREVTGRRMRGSAQARKAFAARRRDGFTTEQLKLATRGAHADEFLRTNGHDVPETILRPSKVNRYVALGERMTPAPRSRSVPEFTEAEEREGRRIWAEACARIAPMLPAGAEEIYFEPTTALGARAGELWVTGPAVIVAWVSRRYAAVILHGAGVDRLEVVPK